MALLNYTTKVEPSNTIADIQRMLMRHQVSAFMTNFDGPRISSVSFQMTLPGREHPLSFRLPCNWRSIREMFNNDAKMRSGAQKRGKVDFDAQSERIAWRIIHDWIESQLALVEVNMVTVPQVFLPYLMVNKDQTLYEKAATDPTFLLGDGK